MIFLILAALSPSMINCNISKVSLAEIEIEVLARGIESYEAIENKLYEEQDWAGEFINGSNKAFIKAPTDPWGLPYHFKYIDAKKTSFLLWSEGSVASENDLVIFRFRKTAEGYKAVNLTN